MDLPPTPDKRASNATPTPGKAGYDGDVTSEPRAVEARAHAPLRPVVRPPVLSAGELAPLVSVPLVPGARVYVAELTPDGPRLLEAADATRRGRSFAELAAEAVGWIENDPACLEPWNEASRVLALRTSSGLASAHIASPWALRALVERLGPGAILAIPEANTLLATAEDDRESIAAMAHGARALWEQSASPVVSRLYRVHEEGVVVPFDPDADDPLAGAIAEAACADAASLYDAQRASVEAAVADGVVPVDVLDVLAPIELGSHPHLGPVTVTLWVEGVNALLPEADLVWLVRADDPARNEPGERDLVRLDELRRAIPEALVPHPTLHPTRLATARFPAPWEVSALALG